MMYFAGQSFLKDRTSRSAASALSTEAISISPPSDFRKMMYTGASDLMRQIEQRDA